MTGLRTVGVGLWSVHTEASAKMAGVARTSIRLLEAMADASPQTRFLLYVRKDFTPPESLARRANVEYRPIRRSRTFFQLGPLLARAVGCQVWFAPGYDGFASTLIPQVSLVHDVFPFTHPEWFVGTDNEQAKAQIARQIVHSKALTANSQATKDETEIAFPGSAAKITVTPLGLGNDVRPDDAPPAGVPFARYVLALGTLEPRKNLPALVRAWAALTKTGRHADVGLVVAGGKGWGEGDLPKGVERLHFTGYVADEELPRLMANAEFYVMPSLNEGFGIPVLEAMAYGAPVLSSDAGALREVGGDAVRYFPPTDEASIRDALDAALSAPEERSHWVEKGRRRAAEFSWDRAARATLELLERCA